MSFAAGIIPYTKYNNELYFLLGLENGKWSGFVGGSELGENPINTAIREFNEETAMIFEDLTLSFNKPPVVELTSTGKTVYIWFINFPTPFFDISNFYLNQSLINDSRFKEKSKLQWFSLNQVKNDRNKILYRLKQTIIRKF